MVSRLRWLVLSAAIVFYAHNAFAAQVYCSSAVVLYPTSETGGDTAHVLRFTDNTACSNACNLGGSTPRSAYIDYADKQLFAYALTATNNGALYGIEFETTAPSRGSGLHGYYTCKVLNMWKY